MSALDTVRQTIGPLDANAMAAAAARWDTLTKPRGSLGRLETLACQVAGIVGQVRPRLTERLVFVLAGDHGVTVEGVSAYPSDVTAQMIYNFVRGGAAINVLARHVGARVIVVDMGVDAELPALPGLVSRKIRRGTLNFAQQSAMTRDEAVACVESGIELAGAEIKSGHTWVVTGDMGIGNTTASSAIIAAMTGASVERVTGRGTGVTGETLARKAGVIKAALDRHQPKAQDALDVLSKVGGFEIGGLAGIMLGAAARRCPVVLDGLDRDRRCTAGGGSGAGRARLSHRGASLRRARPYRGAERLGTRAGARSGIASGGRNGRGAGTAGAGGGLPSPRRDGNV